jgi:peptide chain release factor 1
MKERIEKLLERFNVVETLLGDPATLGDKQKYRALTEEHAYLSELKEAWQEYEKAEHALQENEKLAKTESDPDFLQMIQEEIASLEKRTEALKIRIENLLVPPDPNDSRPFIIELRAGTGGDEAALFVGDCVRMYKCYADRKKWSVETLSCAPSELGGFREYIMGISGINAYRMMKYEAGTHRVQRVPDTETQGRVHTSAITVAVILEPGEEEKIHLDEKDLKIDTYRASGAGGQHVNTTDSAVRITHIPTGTVVYCQEERSQHKNKDKAMRLLSAKILEEKRRKQQQEIASLRASQVGTGDRSERIRTYNFPQNRVTEHRIDLTLFKLDRIMEGDLDEITAPLVAYFYQKQLSGQPG